MLKLALVFLLASVNSYAGEFGIDEQLHLLFFGAFAMIIVYNLGYLLVLKSTTYASYLMFHAGVFIVMLFFTGTLQESWFELNLYGVPVGIFFLTTAMFLGFSKDFLDLNTFSPKIEVLIHKLIIVNVVLVFLSAFSITHAFLEAIAISIIVFETLGLVILSGYLSLYKKSIYARNYFFSFAFLLMTLGVVSLSYFNVIHLNQSIPYLFEIAILIEAGGLSFALANKQKEADMKLRQNELLFKELSHRIQNNLQQIISILTMQMSDTQDMNVKKHFEDTINKIGSIALIHKTLQSSSNLGNVNMYTYLNALIKGYQDLNTEVTFNFECHKGIELTIDKLTPLALILNELITNSIKHAFKETGSPAIHIKLEKNEAYLFTYEDNGSGFEEASITRSIGTKLIILLSKSQLKGTLEVDSDKRYFFSLEFLR